MPRPPAPTGATSRAHAVANLRPQQLEVNHHRVERVLHLVRDARGQSSERHELPRVAIVDCMRDKYARLRETSRTPTSCPSRPLDRDGSSESTSVGHLHRAARGPRRERLLDDGPIRVAVGKQPSQRTADASAGSVGCIAGLLKSSSPDGLNSATASSRCSTADCRFAFCPARRFDPQRAAG